MGRLIYLMNVTLDGFVETADHHPEPFQPDEELHAWFNDQARAADAFLYGRRMYEVMADYWPTAASDPAATAVERDFAAIWSATPKVVFSSSLERVDWNSRLVAGDAGDVLSDLRREYDGDLAVGGPTLAAEFIRRGLVDEYRLVVHPIVLGAGTPFFPPLQEPLQLSLVESRRFTSGVLYLGYRPR